MNRIISAILTLLVTLQASAQILVIPDVHGRSFWKDAVAQNTDIPVIKKNFADLDCRKAFLITSQGKIKEIKSFRN